MGDESGSLGNSLNLNLVWKYYRSIQLVRYLGCCLLLTLFILFHSSCSACNDARIVFLLLTSDSLPYKMLSTCRCGNVAAILELDENLNMQFRVFEAAPHVCILHLCSMSYVYWIPDPLASNVPICSSRNQEVFLLKGLHQITFCDAAH